MTVKDLKQAIAFLDDDFQVEVYSGDGHYEVDQAYPAGDSLVIASEPLAEKVRILRSAYRKNW